jgi:hypothetical protein
MIVLPASLYWYRFDVGGKHSSEIKSAKLRQMYGESCGRALPNMDVTKCIDRVESHCKWRHGRSLERQMCVRV